ncbi:phosphatidylinositol 4,5-bisphosphate 3-kinase catalytic subunit gamma isoform [Danio rerio]|uniref:Phosphatidylinositol 4,5-bisphosphate 3-kinase catalytic subunit gamma isoform n=1 Tax=Danio rerio TaxID=7955 RepID=A0A8M9Q3P0_DANRE|nr:phosphatidylinositol 4,5-bisphosphate 3-kinase catalytic subunit gamma isoform [Danio rerio]XP_692697.2 phosphatidylinositol 4,5-bisphosphate 3-kinase catalytic subunit gamma isoform [Danio rerio]|eukprot:XP_021329311.1 phosphatidylinositol 4,5-bisphosphate 3-kinase catalytic subunit gamma isoform [Danio rerio]
MENSWEGVRDIQPEPCSDNNLVFICKLPAREGFQSVDSREPLQIKLPGQCSVHQLRVRLCMLAQENNRISEPFALLDPERYSLLYHKEEEWYEIYDDFQVLQTLDAPWFQGTDGLQTVFVTVLAQKSASEERVYFQHVLNELIGYDLDSSNANRLGELAYTRRKFATPRTQELKKRDLIAYATEPWTTSIVLPNDQQGYFQRTLSVTLYYNGSNLSIKADLTQKPSDILKIFWESLPKGSLPIESWTSDHVLKVCGREEFLSGDFQLSNYLWVRHCLKNSLELHLSVVAISSLPDDTVSTEYWPLVDSLTGLSSSHEELCLKKKEVEDIVLISLWDCERKFRVKLLGFDIPDLPSKVPSLVYVEATIIYGKKTISSICSTPKEFTDEVLWNTWLEFDILIRDIPQGAKLGLTINATEAAKETKSSSSKVPDHHKGKLQVLYFVNLQLIDHRSLLSQGPHTLNMWPFPEWDEEAVTYEADKLSTATNPDVANSMAITFMLDRYSFPVVLPNGRSSSCSGTSPVSESSSLDLAGESRLSAPFSEASSTATLTRMRNLKKFKEESVHYVSNLPQFLRTVNWMLPTVVQEVHWLLSHWGPEDIELFVALELLSVDFADLKVRRLAVQRLEILSNDEVLKYLLQLVQTLKVEPYHDSFLARFLLKRALRSKRIGHFFFWYLRSEVAGCPFFRQRMAVILEAYLLGCGEAMLAEFQSQVQVVSYLHDVALAVKLLYPDRTDLPSTAPQKLQELLEKCDLPSDFQVPFDPRVRAGSIILKDCKIMASKKKPLWLEFSCIQSEAPPSPPVGIIFKHGDDLRQDMLIIQTLVVMDSIWQEKGLDLNLVPYGCISTGFNIGMIEIVRNAITIASVQRSQGGVAGAFKNNALYDWLQTKCPFQEKHFQATEKFVNSCAGYCVATYVLGIGDRHNDNIMITDQGNLFHIDFGHILGNTKSFWGVNRERVPFVLTPDFLYVMGRVKGRPSLYFQRFRDTCINAYLSLRAQSRLLVTLFSLMLLTGIPELSMSQDMLYLRTALQQDQSEEEARNHLLQQIALCEHKGWTVQANWWFHLMAGIK